MKVSILTTNIPESAGGSGEFAPWYSPMRPCIHCKAEVVKRRETSTGAVIDVRHHPKCNALRQNPAGTLIDMTPILSGSEAVFAFAGWLTSRDEAVTMSAVHDASGPADLVSKFNERQGLADPRPGWDRGIKPMGKKAQGVRRRK